MRVRTVLQLSLGWASLCRALIGPCTSPPWTGARQRSCPRRHTPTLGLQVLIRTRGKKGGGESWLNEAYMDYATRLRPWLDLETRWHKTDADLEAAALKDPGCLVCLDERGREMGSEAFSKYLYDKLQEGGSRVTFVVGGAEGLPPGLKGSQTSNKLSLSKMTFTHLWARVLLAEQVYRAVEIHRGSKYHKA